MYSFVGNRKLVVVSCEFSGYPVPSVTMVDKNGTEIESGNRSASLRVPYTDSEVYFGIYNCSAVNSLGSADVSLELRIAGMVFKSTSFCFSLARVLHDSP